MGVRTQLLSAAAFILVAVGLSARSVVKALGQLGLWPGRRSEDATAPATEPSPAGEPGPATAPAPAPAPVPAQALVPAPTPALELGPTTDLVTGPSAEPAQGQRAPVKPAGNLTRGQAALRRARMTISPRVIAGPLALRRRIPRAVIDPLERALGLGPGDGHLPPVPSTPCRLLVGPANYAGQGEAWARAAETLPGVGAGSLMVNNPFGFAVDVVVPPAAFASSAWGRTMTEHVASHFTHVLLEAARPVLGLRHGIDAAGDIRALDRAGVAIAVVAHGTDVRDTLDHARRFPYSPYSDPRPWREITRLAEHNRRLLSRLAAEGRPLFVSTPDLLVEFPEATWLPVVVDPTAWRNDVLPLSRPRQPIVVHAPSVAAVKGTSGAHPELLALAAEGLIDYRPLRGLSRRDFSAGLRDADIIVDQFGLGSYGVTAVEGLMSGRLVIARIDPIRDRVRELVGAEIPIIESAPESLAETIRSLLADPDRAQEFARRGREFALSVHDGSRSAQRLSGFLGRGGASDAR